MYSMLSLRRFYDYMREPRLNMYMNIVCNIDYHVVDA